MNKFGVAAILVMSAFFSVDMVFAGNAFQLLRDNDARLTELAHEREARDLTPDELIEFDRLRDIIPAEARRLDRDFNPEPPMYGPDLIEFLADLDNRYPREDRAAPEVAEAENAGIIEWIKAHPYRTAFGATVIVLAIDGVVRGKKSLVGRLFYTKKQENAEDASSHEVVPEPAVSLE